jgi:hypothetical protein
MLKALFPSHPYGQQTTLGEAEHLRNPSLKNIREFHAKYYVPNNYCIAMSGDFDPDKAIKVIEKYFGKLKSSPLTPFEFTYEPEQTKIKEVEVKGVEAPYITIAYRINAGSTSREALLAEMIDWVLNNGSTGLIDKNVNQKYLVARANSGTYGLNDYTGFLLQAYPKAGQSLEEAKDIMLQQIDILKKGNWDEGILQAAINNMQLQEIKALESNSSRAMKMARAYMANKNWADEVNKIETMRSITKDEIVAFANKTFKSNNYVIVRKTQGEAAEIEKVEKPPITPIQINRDAESAFFTKIKNTKTTPIEAEFVNYSEDLKSSGIAGQFLPRKLSGVYSEEGVKLSTTGALGMFKLDIVLTPQKSFVVVDLEDQHMMMELNQIINDMATVSTDSFVTILNDDTLFEIAGWRLQIEDRRHKTGHIIPAGKKPGESCKIPKYAITVAHDKDAEHLAFCSIGGNGAVT